MVFFLCNSCGSTYKKNQVENHMRSCGRVVSCIDCQKEFHGSEFQAHTKCISEAEKYNGPDWKPPSSQNKGERKQLAWVETVNSVLEKMKSSMTPSQTALLQNIAKHDNVPRKKPKFLNFISNITKNRFDKYTVESIWDLLEAEWKSQAEQNKPQPTNGTKATNGGDVENDDNAKNGSNGDVNEEVSSKKKKSKKEKRKREEEQEEVIPEICSKKKRKKGKEENDCNNDNANGDQEDSVVNPDSTGDFRWGEVIEQVLMTRDDQSISMKKLKKKVFAEYYARVGDSKGVKSTEDLAAALNKKLKKKKFKVVGETVKLTVVNTSAE